MKRDNSISVPAKVCVICHSVASADSLFCPNKKCGGMTLKSVRCRIDRKDLEAFNVRFPKYFFD